MFEAYLCSRGLEDEVVNDFCLAPFFVVFGLPEAGTIKKELNW